jgi:hypothetical protein
MAREITIIKDGMTANFMANPTIKIIYGLTAGNTFYQEFSKVSLENILFDVIAFCVWTLENLFDLFKAEVDAKILQSRSHTRKWYREKALSFLYGIPLVQDEDYYDTSLLTSQQITDAKIISNAASMRVVQNGYGTLRIKVVRTIGGEYSAVLPEHLAALDVYFNNHVADAGTIVIVTTGAADFLKLVLDIYYDPMQLKADGSRLDGTDSTPVVTKINDFLKSIDFENGQLIISQLTDKLQQVPGVIIPVVREAFSKYGGYDYDAVDNANVGIINEIRNTDAGYMKFDVTNSIINYIAYTE